MKKIENDSLQRIKIIAGHVNAIMKMIEEDAYCVDIVHQSLAVQKALKNLNAKIIEQHIANCVVDQMKKGETDKAIKELLDIYNLK